MGGDYSKEEYDGFALDFYKFALQEPCLFPDVNIDESLLKYSGINSTAELQAFTNLQVEMVPDFIDRLGSSLAAFNAVPNAVGLGALMISMIIELIVKSVPQKDNSYDMFRRIFGEEKASAVRDTMSEYVKRHRIYMNDDRRLEEELRRLEAQLSNHLTILRNSLLHDEQMSTRGFMIWVNGAAFHVQMMIHEARLGVQSGRPQSGYVHSISAAIDLYLMNLDTLTENYKAFMSRYISIEKEVKCYDRYCNKYCYIKNFERQCKKEDWRKTMFDLCEGTRLNEAFMNVVFSNYEPILGLKSHFSDTKTNLTVLINQHDSFTLPSAA